MGGVRAVVDGSVFSGEIGFFIRALNDDGKDSNLAEFSLFEAKACLPIVR